MTAIEKTRLKEMHRPCWGSVWIWLGLALAFFVAEGLLWWMVRTGSGWLALPLVLLLAHLMHAHLIAFHEAAHESLCPVRGWNDVIGTFIGLYGFMSLSLYRATHRTHHAYLATARDEELWPFVIPATPRWLRCLAAAAELTLGLFYTPLLFLRSFLRPGSPIRDSNVRRRIWAELALLAAVWALVLAVTAWWQAWTYFVVLFLAPALLAGDLQSWRKYIEHMGLAGATALASTRSVVPTSAVGRHFACTLFNEPYHGVHHKFGRLPQAALPLFTDLLRPETVDEKPPFASYRRAWVEMIGTLRDPRVGAQWSRGNSQPSSPQRKRNEP